MTEALFTLWQYYNGKWSRATNAVPHREAARMRDAAVASSNGVLYRILPAHLTPTDTP